MNEIVESKIGISSHNVGSSSSEACSGSVVSPIWLPAYRVIQGLAGNQFPLPIVGLHTVLALVSPGHKNLIFPDDGRAAAGARQLHLPESVF